MGQNEIKYLNDENEIIVEKNNADDVNRRCVIYKIENNKTGEFYIGMTINFNRRVIEHIESLSKNRHHNFKLQEAFNKYGLESFKFDILKEFDKEVSVDELRKNETMFIKKMEPEYNIMGSIFTYRDNDKYYIDIEPDNKSLNLELSEKRLIAKALYKHGSFINAAKSLGISERTLYRKMKEFNIKN